MNRPYSAGRGTGPRSTSGRAGQNPPQGRLRTGIIDAGTFSGLSMTGQALRSLYKLMQWAKAQGEHAEALNALEHNRVSGRLRNARMGEASDLLEAGFSTEPGGIYAGCLDGVAWFYHGDRSILICGGSGSGKSSTMAMPQIISAALGNDPQSMIVWDIKKELGWCTADGRTELDGREALWLAPWGVPWAKSEKFNFLEFLAIRALRGLPTLDHVRARVRLAHDNGNKGSESEANGWVPRAAQRISLCLLTHRAECEPFDCNPGAMADAATWTQAEFAEEMTRLSTSEAADGFVADLAIKLNDQYGRLDDDDSAKHFGWVMEEYASAWELYSKGSDLREAVSETTFDLEAFKTRPQALYISFPDIYVNSHSSYIAQMMDSLIETLALADGDVRVNICCDEFANFPKSSSTIKALRLYRDRLVRLITLVQDPNGYDKYRDEGGFKVFRENSISLVWGVRDADTQKNIQERAGYKSVIVGGRNASTGLSMDAGGQDIREQTTPIFPTEEVALIDTGRAILDAPGAPLIVMDRPLFKDLDFAVSYVRDKFAEPMPSGGF